MNFIEICLEEIGDTLSDQIRYNAIAHRMSKLEGAEFEKMVRDDQPTGTREPIVVDHEAQMKQAKG